MSAEPFVVMAKPMGPACNLDCGYCYYLSKSALFAERRFRMTEDVLEAYVPAFIEASPGPVVQFVWHGGEPTLAGVHFYRRALALQERYVPEGKSCLNSLQTNGVLLDDDWCAFLAANRFRVGISIDGPARAHDQGRPDHAGQPTHERVLRGLRRLRDHGIETDVLCTLNARNATEPREVYRFFLDEGVQWLQFLPVVQRDAQGAISPWSVTPEAMGEFLCSVFDEWIRHDVGRIGVQNFLECLLVVGGRPANLCIMSETCGNVLALEHDGSVYACDHFVDADHRLGYVTSDGLAALVEASEQRSFGLAKRDALPTVCRQCSVAFLCHGGCPKDRFATAPDGEDGLNYLCAGYLRFYGHVLPYLRRVTALARSGRPPGAIMAELAAQERDERRPWRDAGRNGPCPCGSGRKYKQCCLASRRG